MYRISFKRRGVYLIFGVLCAAFISKIKNKQQYYMKNLTDEKRNVLIYPKISKILMKVKLLLNKSIQFVSRRYDFYAFLPINATFSAASIRGRRLLEGGVYFTSPSKMRRLLEGGV